MTKFIVGKKYLVKHFPNREFTARVDSIEGNTIWFKQSGKVPFMVRKAFIISAKKL